MSQNTVRKYVCELEERQLISTERTMVVTRDGLKCNGNLLYGPIYAESIAFTMYYLVSKIIHTVHELADRKTGP